MVISGSDFKPDTLKAKDMVSLLLHDDEMETRCECNSIYWTGSSAEKISLHVPSCVLIHGLRIVTHTFVYSCVLSIAVRCQQQCASIGIV